MQRTVRRLLALAVAAPLAIGACGPDDGDDEMEMEEPAAEAPATTQPATPVSVALMPVGASGIEGEASTMTRGEDVEVTLALAGLIEGDEYEVTIEPGTCPMSAPATPTGDAAEGDAGVEGEADGENALAGEDDMGDDDEVGEIDLQVSGTSATGSGTFDAADFGGGVHIAVRDDSDALVACGDVGAAAGLGGTAPGSAAPAAPTGGEGTGGN